MRVPKLALDGYHVAFFLDLNARLTFDNPGDLARYGRTVLDPADISPEVTEFDSKMTARSATVSPARQNGFAGPGAGGYRRSFIFRAFFAPTSSESS
jgi:hypothetical protein